MWQEPQTVYSGFIKGFKHKPIYFMRAIWNIKNQLKKLDNLIRTEFTSVITGGINCSDTERQLIPPSPPRFGCLGTPIFSKSIQQEFLDYTIKRFKSRHNSSATTIRNQKQCRKDQKQNKSNQNSTYQCRLTEITIYLKWRKKHLNELNRE